MLYCHNGPVEPMRRGRLRFVRRLAEGMATGFAIIAGVVIGLALIARLYSLHEIRSTESNNPARADATINMPRANASSAGTNVGIPEGSLMWPSNADNRVAKEDWAAERESAYRAAKARQMLDDAKIWISQNGALGRRRAEHRLKRLRRMWSDTVAGREATEIQITGAYFNARPL
jgi:hypothetical protein